MQTAHLYIHQLQIMAISSFITSNSYKTLKKRVITVELLIVNVAINRLTRYAVPPPLIILQNTKIAVVSFRPHHVLILQHHHNSI